MATVLYQEDIGGKLQRMSLKHSQQTVMKDEDLKWYDDQNIIKYLKPTKTPEPKLIPESSFIVNKSPFKFSNASKNLRYFVGHCPYAESGPRSTNSGLGWL